MITKRWVVTFSLVGLFAAACGDGGGAATTTRAPGTTAATTKAGAAGAQTFAVDVDGKATGFTAGFLAYFPAKVKVHPGDTVTYNMIDTGNPHTVTGGRLIDETLKEFRANPDVEPPGAAKIPDLLPEGPGDANQVAANQCFVESGPPPEDGTKPCPTTAQPEFTGQQTFYNSGWFGPDEPFSLKIAATAPPGEYNFICLLHGPAMISTVEVVDAATSVPTPAEAVKAGAAEREKLVAKAKAVNEIIQKAAPATPYAGAFDLEAAQAEEPNSFNEVNEFGPRDSSISAGGTVTWLIIGAHTITFNGGQDTKTFRAKAPDGTVHINEKAAAPVNSEGQPPPPPEEEGAAEATATAPPEEEEGPPPALTDLKAEVTIDGGSFDGTGEKSSGIVVSFEPPLFAYKLTFTTAGTYKYRCNIHPEMEGTVKVT